MLSAVIAFVLEVKWMNGRLLLWCWNVATIVATWPIWPQNLSRYYAFWSNCQTQSAVKHDHKFNQHPNKSIHSSAAGQVNRWPVATKKIAGEPSRFSQTSTAPQTPVLSLTINFHVCLLCNVLIGLSFKGLWNVRRALARLLVVKSCNSFLFYITLEVQVCGACVLRCCHSKVLPGTGCWYGFQG